MGHDWLMENNIGIAYGAIIENAIGGFGDDRINGNQVDNRSPAAPARTCSSLPTTAVSLRPTSGHRRRVGRHDHGFQPVSTKFDLTEFGAVAADVSWNAATNTISIAGSDTTIIVLGTDFNAATDLII